MRMSCKPAALLAAVLWAAPLAFADDQTKLKPKVDALAQPLVDGGTLVGLVVAIVDGDRTQVFGYGKVSGDEDRTPDGHTVFEIGSVTKTFTALVLADMAEQKLLRLEDPVEKLLPDSVAVPQQGGRAITLLDLATHTSGLPRLPENLKPLIRKNPGNPYADYTTKHLYGFLSKHSLARRPGEQYAYSNLGMGLLGHALARRAGTSYENLIVKRICLPLGMKETRIKLSRDLRARLAQGYDRNGNPVPNWDIPTLAGAGAFRSTGSDMLKFLRANITPGDSRLSAAIRATHRPRHPLGESGAKIALGWHIRPGGKILWHSGQTGGYHSFIAIRPQRKIGVVTLANSAVGTVDQLGFRLMSLLSGE